MRRTALALTVPSDRRSNAFSTGGSASVSTAARVYLRTERRDARGSRLVVQEAVDAFLHELFLPALDAGLRLAGPAHDLVGANTVGAREDDRRPPSVFLRGVTVPGDRFKSAEAQNLRSVLMKSRQLWTSGLGRTCSE